MNNCTLIGRLTKDIELKTTPTGTAVGQFTIAVNRRSRGGEQQADFISCIAWGKVAENMSLYTSKGSQVAVNGRIQTRNYEDKNGKRVYITEVVADEVEFLNTKKNAQQEETRDEFSGFETGPEVDIQDSDLPF